MVVLVFRRITFDVKNGPSNPAKELGSCCDRQNPHAESSHNLLWVVCWKRKEDGRGISCSLFVIARGLIEPTNFAQSSFTVTTERCIISKGISVQCKQVFMVIDITIR